MTLSPSSAQLYIREYPMFTQWALPKGILFLPKEVGKEEEDDFKHYDLVSKTYILMKRLNQSYEHIMRMDAEERDRLFEMEMTFIKEEAKQKEEALK